jgi:chromosome segregation ATPase
MSDEMKRDIETLKQDVGTLRSDVAILRTDVSALKTDVSVLRATTTNIAVAQARLEGQVTGLEIRLDEKLSKGFDHVLSKMDGFAGEVDSSRRQRTLQDEDIRSIHDQLVDHEVRLARIDRPEKKS